MSKIKSIAIYGIMLLFLINIVSVVSANEAPAITNPSPDDEEQCVYLTETCTIDRFVGMSSDDADQDSYGAIRPGHTSIELNSDDWWGGIRFTGFTLPSDATITNATLKACLIGITSGGKGAGLNIYCQNSQAPLTFTYDTNDISSRTRTTAYVLWDDSFPSNAFYDTPGLDTIVQEVVDTHGSVSSLVFILDKLWSPSWEYAFECQSFDFGYSYRPKLHIEYTTGRDFNVDISDPDGDTFDWTITTSPDIGSASGTGENGGTKSATLSGLEYWSWYTVVVTATDGVDSSEETFTFKTRGSSPLCRWIFGPGPGTRDLEPVPPSAPLPPVTSRPTVPLGTTDGTSGDGTFVVPGFEIIFVFVSMVFAVLWICKRKR